jgi:hypothetical protein
LELDVVMLSLLLIDPNKSQIEATVRRNADAFAQPRIVEFVPPLIERLRSAELITYLSEHGESRRG